VTDWLRIFASAQEQQVERMRQSVEDVTLLSKVKGLTVVPTPTPDEKSNKLDQSVLLDPIDKIMASVPVIAKPGGRRLSVRCLRKWREH
jgi:hypothetical protein